MLKRNTALVWLEILALSSLFLMGQESWGPCQDNDGDGFGATLAICPMLGIDCDDTDPNIHPGAIDIPANGIDEDCSGADATFTGDPDLDFLIIFLADDDALMQQFLTLDPNPWPGTDETVYGAIGGSCHWAISDPPFGQMPVTTYDYQGYNQTGQIMDGERSGEVNIVGLWTLSGTLELSGTQSGWIYYSLPMDGMNGPSLDLRSWFVCNYSTGCTASPGDTGGAGARFFSQPDLP